MVLKSISETSCNFLTSSASSKFPSGDRSKMFVKPKNELEMDSSDDVVRASEVPTRSVHGGSSSAPTLQSLVWCSNPPGIKTVTRQPDI